MRTAFMMRRAGLVCAAIATGIAAASCGGNPTTAGGKDGGADARSLVDASKGAEAGADAKKPVDGSKEKDACTGIACDVQECAAGKETILQGYVFAPNGTLPLPDIQVYIPNGNLEPFKPGISCIACGQPLSGEPITTAVTDETGHFVLTGVPTGMHIPIVTQLGKWRRQTYVPEVRGCETTTLTDPYYTRLPKNQSEGDMPHIALTNGGCDQMGCMLPKIGIDPSEFGYQSDGAKKAVNTYIGGGGGVGGPVPPLPITGATPADNLWRDAKLLATYDLGIFSCECDENLSTKGGSDTAPEFKVVTDYLNGGGRIFTTDFQYTWYKYSPNPLIGGSPVGGNVIGIGEINGGAPMVDSPVNLITTFPKGAELANWLKFVYSGKKLPGGATYPVDSNVVEGNVQPDAVYGNIQSLNAKKTLTWGSSVMYYDEGVDAGPVAPRVFTMDTPVGEAMQCGRGVHIDAHIDQDGEYVSEGYPKTGCNTTLKADEAMFAFFFFELWDCTH
jgi:hypothetical protein